MVDLSLDSPHVSDKAALLTRILQHLHSSLELNDILSTATQELRRFLAVDRVMVYQFDPIEQHGKVVAESYLKGNLPSLLGLHFPSTDIPPQARELFRKARIRTIVDVEQQSILFSTLTSPHPELRSFGGRLTISDLTVDEIRESPLSEVLKRPVDPCHITYLTTMGVQASLVVPILQGEVLWGLLVAHHATPREFALADISIAQLIADQMAVAIVQSDLLRYSSEKATRETLINQITNLLYADLSLADVVPSIAQNVMKRLQGSGIRLYLPKDSTGSEYLYTEGVQPAPPYLAHSRAAWLENHPAWQNLIQSTAPLAQQIEGESAVWGLVNLYDAVAFNALQEAFIDTTIRGILILPLVFRSQVLGYLTVFREVRATETLWAGFRDRDPRQQQPRLSFAAWVELKMDQSPPWTEVDLDLMMALHQPFVQALIQRQLFTQVQDLNQHLEIKVVERTAALKRALNFEAIVNRVTDKVRSSLDEGQILSIVVQELSQGLKLAGCDLSLYDAGLTTATIAYEYAEGIARLGGLTIPIDDHRDFYDPLLQGQILHCCDLGQYHHREPVSMLVCPLMDDIGVIGDLWLVDRAQRVFSAEEMRLARQIADHAAIAIRQTRLYASTQAQVKSLQSLNQLKDDFLSTVSHELRTPLSNITMALRLLKRAPTEPKREQYLQILEDECDREKALIEDLLDLQRLEGGNRLLQPELIDLNGWLPVLVHGFQERAQGRSQTLEVMVHPELEPLIVDKNSLDRILRELINNACKYSPPEALIRVTAQRFGAAAQFSVINTGVEISEAEQKRIFEKFYRIPHGDPWRQGGTGLGLALVQRLVESLWGTITVMSQAQEVTFQIRLPIHPSQE